MLIKPQNLPEKVIWYYITGTYILYFIGLQNILAPAIAWLFGFYIFRKLWKQDKNTPPEEQIIIPFGVWVWIIAMLGIEVSLIGSHIDLQMGLGRIIKTTINLYGRTWVLFALFPLFGCLKIRPQLIYRAICILALQSLIFIGIALVAQKVGIPGSLYTSPFTKFGGGNEIFFKVFLYPLGSSGNRLYLFAPWAPALGLVASLYFFLALAEPDKKWRFIGIVGTVAMALASGSRLSNICLIFVPVASWILARISQPLILATVGIFSVISGILAPQIITALQDFQNNFRSQRADSSKVREDLANITLYRWEHDAQIWGTGIIDPKGPAYVEHMPIGSHHHWLGLLYLNGIVGFLAFALAFLWTFIELFLKAQSSRIARTALSLVMVLFLYSFGENLEVLAYLYWPALVMLGIAFKEDVVESSLELQKT